MDKQLGAGALALMIDINDQMASMMPRKATVLRMLGNEVEVQIVGGGKGVFPSVVVPLNAGTEGLVMPMQGSGGYFQPLGRPAGTPYYGPIVNNTPTSTTIVATTYASMVALTSTTLMDLIPECTSGTWDVAITAYATAYRSVTTGGIYVATGNGSGSSSVSLGRNYPQTAGATINVSHVMKGVPNTTPVDIRYAGQGTAGTTNVVSFGALVTATRRT